MSEKDVTVDKALYDGRLLTHRRIDSAWTNYNNFLLIKNYEGCYTALSIILIESVGALSEDKIKEYTDKLNDIQNKSSMLNNGQKVNPNAVNDKIIKKELFDWSISIRKETKNLYLPYELVESDPEKLFDRIKNGSG